jgi:putative ABC transport system permease protein
VRVLAKVRLRLRSLFRRRDLDLQLEDEFRFHLDQLVEEEMAAGLAPEDARRSALRKMGGVLQFQEQSRDTRRVNFVDDLLRDLRYAARSLRRSPGFAALSVLIMALGVGANTAVFSVVNAVLLKPLAYRDAERIVTLSDYSGAGQTTTTLSKQVSDREFREWREQSSSFAAMAYYGARETVVIRGADAEYARVAGVTPQFFEVFGLQPVAGRFPTTEEMKSTDSGAVLIGYGYWQSHFGGDVRALGQTVRVY